MYMKKLLALAVLLAAGLGVVAQAVEDEVRAVGVAADYRSAVNEALAQALEQHGGITLTATERQEMTHGSTSTSTRANGALDDNAKLEMNDAIKKDLEKWAKGRISGYTVLSDRVENGKCRVEVAVRFPGRYVVGRDPNAQRRMAVCPFNLRSKAFGWNGQALDAVEWSNTLANQLNVRLTQTRKFTMLDRAFDREVDAELARLGAPNAAPQDAIRIGQRLGTDYLLVGEVAFNDVPPPAVNPLTGQTLPRPPTLFAEITYRVLLAPTGQLKWTDTVRLDAAAFPASDPRTFISMTAEAAAEMIGTGLMDCLLPREVVSFANGQVFIGEGGRLIHVGDRFTVCAVGEAVKDARTGETIDVLETPVATVEVVSVTAKLSCARVVEGDASRIAPGARLRRVPEPVGAVPAPVTTTVQPVGAGGVRTPF